MAAYHSNRRVSDIPGSHEFGGLVGFPLSATISFRVGNKGMYHKSFFLLLSHFHDTCVFRKK